MSEKQRELGVFETDVKRLSWKTKEVLVNIKAKINSLGDYFGFKNQVLVAAGFSSIEEFNRERSEVNSVEEDSNEEFIIERNPEQLSRSYNIEESKNMITSNVPEADNTFQR